jgi:hypothetical protein
VQVEVFGHPGLISQFYSLVGFPIAIVLKGSFGGGYQGNGDKTHQTKASYPLIHTPKPFLYIR